MNRLFRTALALLAAVLLAAPAGAQTVKIKLGTLAPQGSTWHNLLLEMGRRWQQASNGKVQLKVFAGGTQGNEGEMIRAMSFNKLQAAAITAVGMREITPEPQAEAVPLMVRSYEEYDCLHAQVQQDLEAAVLARGFQVLNWAEVGFNRFFSTEPYRAPEDFGRGKIFTWNGDPGASRAWRAAGFHPVELSSTEMVTALQTGMINIVLFPPLYAYTTNVYDRASNMLDVPFGLLTGATLVKRETWEKIPADLRPRLLEIARDVGVKVRADVRRQNDEALEQMRKRGLKVHQPPGFEAWERTAARANAVVRGEVIPAAFFDKVQKIAQECRAKLKK